MRFLYPKKLIISRHDVDTCLQYRLRWTEFRNDIDQFYWFMLRRQLEEDYATTSRINR